MKKFLIVLLVVIITIICTVLVKDYILPTETEAITFYQTSNQDNLSLQANNLKLTLKYFSAEGMNQEELLNIGLSQDEVDNVIKTAKSQYNCIVEFTTIDQSSVSEIAYDYLVYDNAKNILTSTIVYNNNNATNNMFLKTFISNVYNSSDIHEIDNYLLATSTSKTIVKDEGDTVWALFTADVPSDEVLQQMDLSEVHILIVNPQYDNQYLENQVFEFIVND